MIPWSVNRLKPLLIPLLLALLGCATGVPEAAQPAAEKPVAWKQCLQQPPAWYGGAEAVRIADNVLFYQRAAGGWHKNVDMAVPLDEAARTRLRAEREQKDGTIDNGATNQTTAF